MSETLASPATLAGNFMRSVGLEGLSQTLGNPITLVLYRGIPFIEREHNYVVTRHSVLEMSLNCRQVMKNTAAIKFYLDDPNAFMEVYLKEAGSVHIQVYESQDVLTYHDDGEMPIFKLAHITWNEVSLGWFPNLDRQKTR